MVVGVISLLGACHRTLAQGVTQPNPLREPNETLRISEPVVIITGDMDLEVPKASSGYVNLAVMERLPLHNVARFNVVSRDRLRFHVQLEHKWTEYADLRTWNCWLEVDGETVYRPEEIELRGREPVTHMWDREVRSAERDAYGNITQINEDGHLNRQTLGSVSLFRGRGDIVFYHRNLFTPETRSVTLVMERDGLELRFRWNFEDTDTLVAQEGPIR